MVTMDMFSWETERTNVKADRTSEYQVKIRFVRVRAVILAQLRTLSDTRPPGHLHTNHL